MRHPYHRLMAMMGRGDLHPGGAGASVRLLDWLAERSPRRVLEVGAGGGNTARRLIGRGWQVCAMEPDPVLADRLRSITGLEVLNLELESFKISEGREPFDAVVAESVLYGTQLPLSLHKLRALLAPGGLLAISEMVWRPGTSAALAAQTHTESLRRYGIAGVSSSPLCWADWRASLKEAGFELLREERLGDGSPSGPSSDGRTAALAALARDPRLLPDWLRYRLRQRGETLDNTHFESWLAVAQKPGP